MGDSPDWRQRERRRYALSLGTKWGGTHCVPLARRIIHTPVGSQSTNSDPLDAKSAACFSVQIRKRLPCIVRGLKATPDSHWLPKRFCQRNNRKERVCRELGPDSAASAGRSDTPRQSAPHKPRGNQVGRQRPDEQAAPARRDAGVDRRGEDADAGASPGACRPTTLVLFPLEYALYQIPVFTCPSFPRKLESTVGSDFPVSTRLCGNGTRLTVGVREEEMAAFASTTSKIMANYAALEHPGETP